MMDHLKLKSDILQEIIHQCGKLDELEKAGIDFTQTERDLLLAVKPVLDNLDQGHPAEDSTSRFQESPGLYRQVFEMLATGIMIVDEASHTILEINQAACNLLNRSREELLGSTCYLHGCAEGLDTCPVRNVQKNILSWEMMLRQHSNTESFPVKKDVIPFRLGKRRYLLESFVDLQSTKKTEKELAESKQKLEAIAQNFKDVIWTRDIDLNLTYVSPAVLDVRGFTPEEFKNLPFDKQIDARSLQKLKPVFQKYLQSIRQGEKLDVAISEQLEAFCKDGSTIPVEITAHPVYDVDGNFDFFLGVTRDISGHKKTESELARLNEELEAKVLERTQKLDQALIKLTASEERYRNLFATMTSGVVVHNPDGSVDGVNTAALDILGVTMDQIMGITSMDPRWESIHEDGSPYPGESHPVMIALATSREVRDQVMGIYNPIREELVWININAVPIFNKHDQISSVYVVFEDITKRKIAELQLKSSEEKYRKLFNEAIDSIIVVDTETGLIVDCNDNACKLLEKSRNVLVGMHQRFLHAFPGTEEGFGKDFQKHLKGESGLVTEEQIITQSGQIRDVLIKSNPLEMDGHKYIQGIFQDVTDRKLAERELRIIAEQRNRFFDLAVDMLCIAGFDGYFKQISAAWTKTLGWSEEEIYARQWLDFVHPDDREATIHIGGVLFEGEKVVSFENRYLCKDGTYKWISWNSEAVPEFDLIYAVARDITESKRAQDLIKASQQSLEEAQRIAHLGNWTWDIQQETLEWSEEVFRIFGYEAKQCQPTYENFVQAIHPEDRDEVTSAVTDALGGQVYEVEHRILRPDGVIRHVLERGEVIFDNNNMPCKMLGIVQDVTERVLAEKHIKELLNMSEKIFTTSPMGLLVYREDGDCVMANETAAAILGATQEQVLAQNFRKLDSWQRSGLIDAADKVLKARKPNRIEIHVTTSFGLEKWLNCSFNVFHIRDQLNLLVVIEDISDRKQTEESLRTAIQFNQMLSAGNGVDEIIEYGLEKAVRISNSEIGYFHFVNPDQRTIALTAWSIETLAHCEVGEKATHYPIDEAGIWVECIRKRKPVIHNDYSKARERKGLPEGHVHLVRDMAIPLFDGKKVIAVLGVGNKKQDYDTANIDQLSFIAEHMINTIQRLRAEDALNTANQRYSLATRSADVGIWDWDVKTNSLVWDNRMYQLYGLKQDDFAKAYEAWTENVHPEDKEKSQQAVKKALRGEKEFESEFRVVHPDGKIRHLRSYADVYRDASGQPVRMIGLNLDITEQKQIEAELIQARDEAEIANRAKSEFLANMSHEIRTPLNAVIGFSELLGNLSADQQTRRYAGSIKTAGKGLLTLINDVLDLSKIEAGMLEISPHPMNLHQLFTEIQQLFKDRISDKGLHFSMEIHPQLPVTILLDEIRLRQVLLNLVGNATKFTDKGHIKLTARKVEKKHNPSTFDLIINVEDTGIGIPKEDLEMIFDSFKQQSGQITRKYGGTGLGLTISRKLVEMMNGTILAASRPGLGSTFQVRLFDVAVAPSGKTAKAAPECIMDAIQFEPATILVVDDVASNREMLRELLSKVGLCTLEAKNGKEGTEIAIQSKPDLILMDIRMPEMDGYEATSRIRSFPECETMPIIALTAAPAKKSKKEIARLGLNGYITKPINVEELFAELSHFLVLKKRQTRISELGEETENHLAIFQAFEANPKFRTQFESDILPSLKKMSGVVKPSVLESICQQLKELGKQMEEPAFLLLADHLSTAMKDFDLSLIKSTVQKIVSSFNGGNS